MIIIKTQKEIETMRRGGKILASVMDAVGKKIAPGVSTLELDNLAEKMMLDNGGTPAFKGYGDKNNPFPATICSSINYEIVHGIPSEDKIIKMGDIVKIDMGIKYEGMITDMARTFPAGKISNEASKIMKATKKGLNAGIAKIKAGVGLKEYASVVESYVKKFGFSIVRDLVGHGVGRILHEDPQIPNYHWKGKDIILREGMTIALEPMVNVGTYKIKLGSDGWVYETKDEKLSAHFEDTVLVKKDGHEILTR